MRSPLWLALPALALLGCGAAPVRQPLTPPGPEAVSSAGPDPSTPLAPGGCTSGPVTYYADGFAGRRTASGERYDPSAMTAAHRQLPFGTWLDVSWHGRRVRVRVNDRGGPRRGVDLSRAAAERLDMIRAGRVQASICGG